MASPLQVAVEIAFLLTAIALVGYVAWQHSQIDLTDVDEEEDYE